jgi:hypothetical protein
MSSAGHTDHRRECATAELLAVRAVADTGKRRFRIRPIVYPAAQAVPFDMCHPGWASPPRRPARSQSRSCAARRVAAASVHIRPLLVGTEAFEQSRCERKRIEMRFAHLKRILRLDRLRL